MRFKNCLGEWTNTRNIHWESSLQLRHNFREASLQAKLRPMLGLIASKCLCVRYKNIADVIEASGVKNIRQYLYNCCANNDCIIVYHYRDKCEGRWLDSHEEYDEVWHTIYMEMHTNKLNVLIDTKANCIVDAWL